MFNEETQGVENECSGLNIQHPCSAGAKTSLITVITRVMLIWPLNVTLSTYSSVSELILVQNDGAANLWLAGESTATPDFGWWGENYSIITSDIN